MHLALDEFDWGAIGEVRQMEREAEIETHRIKLVTAPEPAAARTSWLKGITSLSVPVNRRMRLLNWSYARNSDAFSAIAPTTGAGRP